MIMGNRHPHPASAFIGFAIILCLISGALSQNTEKPKLKDFGSSLKRVRWDKQKQTAVEDKSKSTAESESDIDVVKVETSLVTSDILILDARGNPVSGLTENDFVISEDGKPQQVGMLSVGDDSKLPRSIVLVIDYSGSLAPYISLSVDAAKTMVEQLRPNDRMAIVTDDVKLLSDFTQDKENLKAKLESLKSKAHETDAKGGWFRGHSLQFSALMATMRELFTAEDQRVVIIFQTDGDQLTLLQPNPAVTVDKKWRAEFSIDDIYQKAEKSRVTIYTVVPGIKLLGFSEAEQTARVQKALETLLKRRLLPQDNPRFGIDPMASAMKETTQTWVARQSALARLSTISGAWISFLEEPSEADEIYAHILSDMNRRYVVGYYPTNKEHDGRRRRIEITVRDHPEYTVMGHRGYYAPGPD